MGRNSIKGKMKISIITETFPPEVNGVAMTLNRLSEGLVARGHKVQIIRPRQNKEDQPVAVNGRHEITVRGLPIPGYDGLHFGLPCPLKFRHFWKKERPDIVHVATEGPLGWNAVQIARKLKIPLVSSFHTNFHSYGSHYGYGRFMKSILRWLRYVHNKASLTFVPAQDVLNDLRKEQFRDLRILSRGVDTKLFSPQRRSAELRKSWGVKQDQPVALFVGRVAEEKNIPLTIKAYERMRSLNSKLKLVIVGDGPARKELEEKHPEIIFAGMRLGEDLATHYASADLFLFASTTETFGNVITEAMASGLVALTFNYAAAQKYIQNGVNGIAVPYNDTVAYEVAATQLIKHPENWKGIRNAARESTLGISWDKVIDGYLNDLDSVLKQK